MKILLAAINSKYIHSNLAVYSLCAYAKSRLKGTGVQIDVAEYTINQQADDILRSIYRKRPDVLCFSCYIWNITYTEEVIREIKKLLPNMDVWAGGPEVSYDAEKVLRRLPQIRGVMKGEGEATFHELCNVYAQSEDRDSELRTVRGITFCSCNGEIIVNSWREPVELDEVPFVYQEPERFSNKIIYYETSRGCPFSCSYCLSSVDKRLRFRSLDLVKQELQFFIEHQIPQVKFVDRTFNCNHVHAMEIWRYIAEHDNGITNFHFEVAADLLNEEELALIESMRPGLIQLEIGVQSTNTDTIREIRRTMKFEQVKENVIRIKNYGNIHQHLDLIAGLPYEDIRSFAKSFDDVYALRPDQLQLGFLKVLKGSYMKENCQKYELVCKDTPPYEVLSTKWLSYEDVLELKGIEEMTEVYYNSGQFEHTMEALQEEYTSAYELYRELWQYYDRRHYLEIEHKRSKRYEILLDFVREHLPERADYIQEQLVYDYYLRENAKTRPEFAGEYRVEKEFIRKFYETQARIYLPSYEAYDKNQMRKMTHIEYFPISERLILFDYMNRNPLNRQARTCMIERGLKRKD